MKIQLTRSGGIAGMVLSKSLDTSTVPAADAAEIEDLVTRTVAEVEASRFKTLSPMADGYQYDIDVRHDGTTHHLQLHDGATGESGRKLISRLTRD